MLASSEISRPLPPSKARKATAAAMSNKLQSTPPPAYVSSTFTFPSRRQPDSRRDILGSPMDSTYRMMSWEGGDQSADTPTSPPPEDLEWMSEKSREELQELLVKADGIIKERENELGLTSVFCKNLYTNNAALKTKHEALLARIPMSPARSISSPEHLSRIRSDSLSIPYSTSDSGLGGFVKPLNYPGHTRKISIATADISLLADQNAELLGKLQQLEEEATTADHAGRRELKRLEKEISFLREALEKTQAKSEALEEKVQDAVVGEAWRRKKEREAKFKAMRNPNPRGDSDDDDGEIRDFAPGGPRFGGRTPTTDTFPFFPAAESSDRGRQMLLSASSSVSNGVDLLGSLGLPQHALISQLLIKVQELEETNTRILHQQSETATQLSQVQRDAMQMTKVYECLADNDEVELELVDGEGSDPDTNLEDELLKVDSNKDAFASQTIRFRSLKRTIEKDLSAASTLSQQSYVPSGKSRKTVMGLFDDGDSSVNKSVSAWSEGNARLSWSSLPPSEGSTSPRTRSLSPLHFFSPASRTSSDAGAPMGLTLQNELDMKLGDGGWNMEGQPHHLRTTSLYDLSQISIPPSPTPTSRPGSRRGSEELLDYDAARKAAATSLTPNAMANGHLRLSVEPPTPDKVSAAKENDDHMAAAGMPSPRIQLMSQTLRARGNRWVERRAQSQQGRRCSSQESRPSSSSTANSKSTQQKNLGITQRMSSAVDSMIENFQNLSATAANAVDAATSPTQDKSLRTPTATESTELHEENALQLHVAPLSPTQKRNDQLANNANSSVVFQAWLWLQFAIVIFVFLFAMARKGPKVVLAGEGADKGTVARRR